MFEVVWVVFVVLHSRVFGLCHTEGPIYLGYIPFYAEQDLPLQLSFVSILPPRLRDSSFLGRFNVEHFGKLISFCVKKSLRKEGSNNGPLKANNVTQQMLSLCASRSQLSGHLLRHIFEVQGSVFETAHLKHNYVFVFLTVFIMNNFKRIFVIVILLRNP